jgi:hypothetical protein
VRGYAEFLPHARRTIADADHCAAFAGQFGYIADSPFVLIGGYHVDAADYGYYFAATAFALMSARCSAASCCARGRSPGAMLVIGGTILPTRRRAASSLDTRSGSACRLHGAAGRVLLRYRHHEPSASALALQPVPHNRGHRIGGDRIFQHDRGCTVRIRDNPIGGSSPRIFAVVMLVTSAIAAMLAVAAAVLRHRAKVRDSTNPPSRVAISRL